MAPEMNRHNLQHLEAWKLDVWIAIAVCTPLQWTLGFTPNGQNTREVSSIFVALIENLSSDLDMAPLVSSI